MPNRSYFFDQFPLVSGLEFCSSLAERIQHVTPAIGYYNSALPTLLSDFNNLGKEPATHGIFVAPLLTDRNSLHLNCPLKL
jgi:hypothetical protein